LSAVLNRLDLRGVDDVRPRLPRPEQRGEEPVDAVREILSDVRRRGDVAVLDLTERFDGVRLDSLRVPSATIESAVRTAPSELVDALTAARDAVRGFHETQRRPDDRYERDGVVIEGRSVPVSRAGVYVPGGRGAYPSTVLMTAVPARVAGVSSVVLCVPPDRATGTVATPTLVAADLAGVDEVYAVGGAQAIGAMAYGTESIAPVDVIAGPGNVYVAVAKREVADVVGVASAFAGPSEIVVVADDTTPPDFAAIDVIVQAEHGPDGLAWLITWSESAADAIDRAIGELVARAPRRNDIESSLRDGGWLALVDGPMQAIEVVNLIAPEHLQLMSADAEDLAPRVRNAGAVFCGAFAPASVGDYIAGPSHVLPTHGTARFAGALTVDDFVKVVHTISLDRTAFEKVAPFVETLAEAEGFDAHAESIKLRRDSSWKGPS
jgi:histidinol dehydrogenase